MPEVLAHIRKGGHKRIGVYIIYRGRIKPLGIYAIKQN